MAVDRGEVKKLLKEKGLKVTAQRLAVLETVASRPEEHLTAEEIFTLVKVSCPDIGLATVYRTVQLLLELELIDRISLDDGFIRYEIADARKSEHHRHHHLICLKCGSVTAFQRDMLEALETGVKTALGFHVTDHEVKLYGFCRDCLEKRKEENQEGKI